MPYSSVTMVLLAPMPSASATTVAAVNHRSRAISRSRITHVLHQLVDDAEGPVDRGTRAFI